MWGRLLKGYKNRSTAARFARIFRDFWTQEAYYIYATKNNELVVVVEMLDPAKKTGIWEKFGLFFEGYRIVVKKSPRGYIRYAKRKKLFN